MRSKKTWWTISLLICVFFAFPADAASDLVDVIDDSFPTDVEDVAYATDEDGTMVVAYPTENAAGVYVSSINGASDGWMELQFLASESVEGTTESRIHKLSVELITGVEEEVEQPVYIVHWVAKYYDASGNFVNATYNLYRIYPDTGDVKQYPLPTSNVQKTRRTMFQVVNISEDSDRFVLLWNQAGTLYAQLWEEGELSPAAAIDAVGKPWNAQARFVDDEVFVVSDDSEAVRFGVLSVDIGEAPTFSTVKKIAKTGRVLDVTVGNDDIFVLYQRGQHVWRKTIDTRDVAVRQKVQVFRLLKPDEVRVVFNDYGKGQYIALAKKKYSVYYSFWRAGGWKKRVRFENNYGSMPEVHTFSDGRIDLIWTRHLPGKQKWWRRAYTPGSERWSHNQELKKVYASRRLAHPFAFSAVRDGGGKVYIEAFRTVEKKKKNRSYVLRQWNIGTALSGAPRFDLPQKNQLLSYAVDGEYYFLLMKKGSVLKSIIATEEALFE